MTISQIDPWLKAEGIEVKAKLIKGLDVWDNLLKTRYFASQRVASIQKGSQRDKFLDKFTNLLGLPLPRFNRKRTWESSDTFQIGQGQRAGWRANLEVYTRMKMDGHWYRNELSGKSTQNRNLVNADQRKTYLLSTQLGLVFAQIKFKKRKKEKLFLNTNIFQGLCRSLSIYLLI